MFDNEIYDIKVCRVLVDHYWRHL